MTQDPLATMSQMSLRMLLEVVKRDSRALETNRHLEKMQRATLAMQREELTTAPLTVKRVLAQLRVLKALRQARKMEQRLTVRSRELREQISRLKSLIR